MHLKVLEIRKDPAPAHDHDVPVLVASVGLPRPGRPPRTTPREGAKPLQTSQEHIDIEDEEPFEVDMDADWDLTTRQVILVWFLFGLCGGFLYCGWLTLSAYLYLNEL